MGFALGGFGTAGGCLFGLFLVDGANSLIIRCQQVEPRLASAYRTGNQPRLGNHSMVAVMGDGCARPTEELRAGAVSGALELEVDEGGEFGHPRGADEAAVLDSENRVASGES